MLDELSGAVIGTIDVESEKSNAFDFEEATFLEKCARAIRGFWRKTAPGVPAANE